MSGNVFKKAAERAARSQNEIEQDQGRRAEEARKETQTTNAATLKEQDKTDKAVCIRIPTALHKQVAYHRIETGESMNALVVRLLTEELSH